MILKLTKRLATALLCGLCLFLSAQTNSTLKQREHDIELKKGVLFLNEGPASFSAWDLEIIEAYNFESYRRNDVRTKVQLVKGPLLELLAKEEIQEKTALGKVFAGENNHTAENTIRNSTNELILQLNIGLGYTKKQHTEVTH